MSDLLFESTEPRLDGAIRWQKRALEAEARVAELNAAELSDLGTLTHAARRLGVERSEHTLGSLIGLLEARVEELELKLTEGKSLVQAAILGVCNMERMAAKMKKWAGLDQSGEGGS